MITSMRTHRLGPGEMLSTSPPPPSTGPTCCIRGLFLDMTKEMEVRSEEIAEFTERGNEGACDLVCRSWTPWFDAILLYGRSGPRRWHWPQ